jgi:hypothetical protein
MNTSHNKYDALESIIYKDGLRISKVDVSNEHDKLFIRLNNGRVFVIFVKNYGRLKNASVKRLKNYRLVGNGIGIHWPDLNEDLSLKGFMKEFITQRLRSGSRLVIA